MRTVWAKRAVMTVAAVAVLVGCTEGITPSDNTEVFHKRYDVARDALEGGRYQAAARHYRALLPDAKTLTPRIRLELAHAYLRNGDYTLAAREAQTASTRMDNMGKAAAQAVLATALHEMAIAARQAGDQTVARQNMQAAEQNFAAALGAHPELDPLGALAGRQAAIKVQLGSP